LYQFIVNYRDYAGAKPKIFLTITFASNYNTAHKLYTGKPISREKHSVNPVHCSHGPVYSFKSG